MSKKLSKNTRLILCLVVSLVLFFFLKIPVIDVRVTKLEQISIDLVIRLDRFFAPLASPRLWFQNQNHLRNKIMEDELALRQKDAELFKLKMVESENQELRSSLASASAAAKVWLPAHLLFSEPDFSIDLGSRAGLETGATVASEGIYIGSVTWVGANYATVTTLASEQIRIGVRVGKSGVLGVITRIQQGIVLTCISRTDQVNVGDGILTIGDTNGTQSNLLVGYISSNRTHPADPVSSFKVNLALDPHNIDTVIVMRSEE